MTTNHTNQTYHAISADAALTALEASVQGLSADEAERRLEINGPNRLPDPSMRSPVLRFLRIFTTS